MKLNKKILLMSFLSILFGFMGIATAMDQNPNDKDKQEKKNHDDEIFGFPDEEDATTADVFNSDDERQDDKEIFASRVERPNGEYVSWKDLEKFRKSDTPPPLSARKHRHSSDGDGADVLKASSPNSPKRSKKPLNLGSNSAARLLEHSKRLASQLHQAPPVPARPERFEREQEHHYVELLDKANDPDYQDPVYAVPAPRNSVDEDDEEVARAKTPPPPVPRGRTRLMYDSPSRQFPAFSAVGSSPAAAKMTRQRSTAFGEHAAQNPRDEDSLRLNIARLRIRISRLREDIAVHRQELSRLQQVNIDLTCYEKLDDDDDLLKDADLELFETSTRPSRVDNFAKNKLEDSPRSHTAKMLQRRLSFSSGLFQESSTEPEIDENTDLENDFGQKLLDALNALKRLFEKLEREEETLLAQIADQQEKNKRASRK